MDSEILKPVDAPIDPLLSAAHQASDQVKLYMEKGREMTTKKECAVTTRDLVVLLADLSEQIEVLIGKRGTISVFRYAGRQLGKRLGAGQNGDPEMARSIVAKFFQDKEFMSAVNLEGKNAELQGCQIGLELHARGIEAGSHALCNFGFGLIDGVTEAVTGKKIITLHVSSEQHDAGVTCHETW
jgi:predicted hydrocarbon binding protein